MSARKSRPSPLERVTERARDQPRWAAVLGGVAVAAAALAGANEWQARRAKREHPPLGSFVDVDGVRLHYVERGAGEPLVLLHGNGSGLEDFLTSDLVDRLAGRYRVILFDRPGYGHSTRPRSVLWTPAAQGDLLVRALGRLGVDRFFLLGHSWGAMIAVALALEHPKAVSGLILAGGYFYGSARLDAPLFSGPAIPVIGDVLRYTVSPLVGRAIWPKLMARIFGPNETSEEFEAAIKEMALRPSQMRASAAESAMMIPAALAIQSRYAELSMPVAIVVGGADRMVTPNDHSMRLKEDLPSAELIVATGTGHMVHHSAPEKVVAAVEAVARRAAEAAPAPLRAAAA